METRTDPLLLDALDGNLRRPCPNGCGRRVWIRFETDRRGQVIETLEPCVCQRVSRIKIKPGTAAAAKKSPPAVTPAPGARRP